MAEPARKIRSILVANRGEIACRIIRTCKKLGIRTVAIFSDPDAQAPHVTLADAALPLHGSESKDTYLNIEKIIAAARAEKVDALHPGYGFLSENPLLPEALEAAGIVFIGPTATTMRALGDKIRAKELAALANVPTVPSLNLELLQAHSEKAVSAVTEFAATHGFPLLVKAAAGGGGRGMRRISSNGEIESAIKNGAREAAAFFSDGRIFIEKLIEHARHVEVQILGDKNGAVTHLWDRDCTMQRRHQKVIEEAPAPFIAGDKRAALLDAAVRLAKSAKYTNLGTAEFLLDRSGNFYFLEVNSRLQVEHPVTEQHTDLDLVEIQIKVAEGEALSDILKTIPPPEINNHAIEVRICAEDPRKNFVPSVGRIELLSIPISENLRIESGVQTGSIVSHYYDPLVAKVIATGQTRDDARLALINTLKKSRLIGPSSNIPFLISLLEIDDFISFTHDINLAETIAQKASASLPLMAALYCVATATTESEDPWSTLRGFRLFGSARQTQRLILDHVNFAVTIVAGTDTITVVVESPVATESFEFNAAAKNDEQYTVKYNNGRLDFFLTSIGRRKWITFHGATYEVTFESIARGTLESTASHATLTAPLPGKIVEIRAAANTEVAAGAIIFVLESMKMEHTINAPFSGKLTEITAVVGANVDAGSPLATLTRQPRISND